MNHKSAARKSSLEKEEPQGFEMRRMEETTRMTNIRSMARRRRRKSTNMTMKMTIMMKKTEENVRINSFRRDFVYGKQ